MSEETPTNTPAPEATPAPAPTNTEPTTDNLIDALPIIEPADPAPETGTAGAIDPDQPYTLAIDEKHQVSEAASGFMTAQAKQLGLPAEAVSSFINTVLANAAENEAKERNEEIAALQKQWGADFSNRAKNTAAFADRVAKSVGLSKQEAAFLSTPAGYKLMYGISKMFGEQKAITASGGTAGIPDSMEQRRKQAEDMRTNRENPMYELFNDPAIPRSKRVVAWKKYNQLVGREVYPEI